MKKIIFCLPGTSFSHKFLLSWTQLLSELARNGYQCILSQGTSSMVHFARTKCLGADVLRGKDQKPFDGKIDYDYLFWIDSDIIFKPSQFIELFERNKDKEVFSGWYGTEGGIFTTTVEKMNDNDLINNGSYKFLTIDELQKRNEPFEVDYTGLGWCAMKKGIIEEIEYPWFSSDIIKIEHNGKIIQDISSEDVTLFRKIRDNNIKIYVDPLIRVGHEKTILR